MGSLKSWVAERLHTILGRTDPRCMNTLGVCLKDIRSRTWSTTLWPSVSSWSDHKSDAKGLFLAGKKAKSAAALTSQLQEQVQK